MDYQENAHPCELEPVELEHEELDEVKEVEEKFEKYFAYLARCEAKFCTTTLKN